MPVSVASWIVSGGDAPGDAQSRRGSKMCIEASDISQNALNLALWPKRLWRSRITEVDLSWLGMLIWITMGGDCKYSNGKLC